MQRVVPIVKKLFYWSILVVGTYAVVTTLWFGQSLINERNGYYQLNWSGLDALFTDDTFGFATNSSVATPFDGADGPYLIGSQQATVDRHHRLVIVPRQPARPLTVVVDNAEQDSFQVVLRASYTPPPQQYTLPARMLALSDIEGNFNAFYGLLVRHGVMDAQYHWTFGAGHLVLNGDFVDRGRDVTQVLWLIYHLEGQALQHGGQVHYILGNHEIMNLQGNVSDMPFKYLAVAKRLSGETAWEKAAPVLYGEQSELGRWLRSKNVAEKIGPYLFVHGGLNPKLVQARLTLADLNRIARKYYGMRPTLPLANAQENLVLSTYDGPYWDRSLAMSWLYRGFFLAHDPLHASVHKTTQAEVQQVLSFYRASTLLIGHSVVEQVQEDYEGHVIKLDVKHGEEKHSARTQGLLLEAGQAYRVDAAGGKVPLGKG